MNTENKQQLSQWFNQSRLPAAVLPTIPCTDTALRDAFIRELKQTVTNGVRLGISQTFKDFNVESPFPGHSPEWVCSVIITKTLKEIFGEVSGDDSPSIPKTTQSDEAPKSDNVFQTLKQKSE